MRSRFRTIRLAFKKWMPAVTLLLLVVLVVFILLGPTISNYRQLPERLRVGREIVAAVNEFRSQNLRWPTSVDELVPKFLPKPPPINHRWSLHATTNGNERPHLRGFAGMHRMLHYYFPPANHPLFPEGVDRGWVLDDEGTKSFLARE